MDMTGVQFTERYDSKEYGTTTLYFDAPKELLPNQYDDAEYAEIAIECPTDLIEACSAGVGISPVNDGSSYDWCDIDLQYEEIDDLIDLYYATVNKENRKGE